MLSSFVALSVLLSVRPGLGALLTDPSQLPVNRVYDYIVVGSGPGGATVASRLSEDETKYVLLIEAGDNPDDDINTQIPWMAPFNTHKHHDWNFTTTPQTGYNGRSIDYARGKTLGGSSALNFMVWDRGPLDDWNRLADVSGDPGWSWDAIQSYALKVERQTPPVDGHDTSTQWNATIHGTDGPLSVTLPGFTLASDARVINTTAELSLEFPFNPDMSSGHSLGIGWSPTNLNDGVRDSSWTSYLRPNIDRPNLDVLINTQVTRVLQTGTEGGLPAIRGVEFAVDAHSTIYTLNAAREVILSAGAVQTPQILLLSGIGNAAQLNNFSIPVIVDNPHVGTNFQDHVFLPNHWQVKDEFFTMDIFQQNATVRASYQGQWESDHTGPLSLNCCPQIGWLRVDTNLTPFNNHDDPTSGPTASHYEMIFTPAFGSFTEEVPTTGKYFMIITAVISPVARGTLTLASADPWDYPLINPNLLGHEYDVGVMREALKASLRFTNGTAFQDYLDDPVGDFAIAAADGSDGAFEDYARARSTTVWHPSSTAPIAPYNSTAGVLDPDLKVKGTVGLRVVDCSAFPYIPASHPQYPIYILAERASDLIKADAA